MKSIFLKPLQKIYYYICNRWLDKRHALTSKLKRGKWHDYETRLLHAAFDELVNFVEIEQAALHFTRLNQTSLFNLYFKRRNPKAGIDALKWTAQLKNSEEWVSKNDPQFGQPTTEAIAAKEILALYTWWKEEYPKWRDSDETAKGTYFQIQAAKTKEETAMLIRLVEIRQYIWT